MNQRIIKLVRQALKDSVSIRVESVIAGSIDGHGIIEIPNSFAEKFAELIVRECAMIAQLQDSDCVVDVVDYNSGRTWAGIDILKHFGVEE